MQSKRAMVAERDAMLKWSAGAEPDADSDLKVETYDDLLRKMGIQIVNDQLVSAQPIPVEKVASLPTAPVKTTTTTTHIVLPSALMNTGKDKGKDKGKGKGSGGKKGQGQEQGQKQNAGHDTRQEDGSRSGTVVDASLLQNYNAMNRNTTVQPSFIPNSNLTSPPPTPTAIPPEIQNSYIFNKYFKKDFGEPALSAIPPRGTIEHLNYRLRNYLEWLRVQQVKSKKMTFH